MIEIKEVTSKREMKAFCNFQLKLYKGNKYFCPAFYSDEMAIYDPKKKGQYDFCEEKFFLAYRDGKIVGRICALINHAFIDKWGVKCGRFTRYDVIDDYEVSKALFDAAFAYFKEKGLESVQGPMGYTDLDREGLLVEGFDYCACYGSSYNFPYYAEHIEKYGFVKQVDWLEWRLNSNEEKIAKISKVAKMVEEKYGVKECINNKTNITKFLNEYSDRLFNLLDAGYAKLHGTVPFTDKVRQGLIAQVKLMLNGRYLSLVQDKDGNIIGFGLIFPGIWHAMQKAQGKLFPFGFVPLLKAIKHPKEVELALIAVDEEWKRRGVTAVVLNRLANNIIEAGIEHIETNAVLEDNLAMRNQWEGFDGIQHKRKRCYVKNID